MAIQIVADVLRDDYTVSEGFANFIGSALILAFFGWLIFRIYQVLIEPRLNESPEEAKVRRDAAKTKAEEAKKEWQDKRDREVNGPPPQEAKFQLIALKKFYADLKREGDKYETLSLSDKFSPRHSHLEGWRYRYRKGQAKIALYERVVKEYEARHGSIDISKSVIAQLQHLDRNYDYFQRLYSDSERPEREKQRQQEHVRYQAELKKASASALVKRVEHIEQALSFLGSEEVHSAQRARLLAEKAMWDKHLAP